MFKILKLLNLVETNMDNMNELITTYIDFPCFLYIFQDSVEGKPLRHLENNGNPMLQERATPQPHLHSTFVSAGLA